MLYIKQRILKRPLKTRKTIKFSEIGIAEDLNVVNPAD